MPAKKFELTHEDAEKIRSAASHLALLAPTLVGDSVQYAIGALSLALGTAAAIAKVPYTDLISMLSKHFEAQLLAELELELKATTKEVLSPKSSEVS